MIQTLYQHASILQDLLGVDRDKQMSSQDDRFPY